jgi:hypothetical protein
VNLLLLNYTPGQGKKELINLANKQVTTQKLNQGKEKRAIKTIN